MHFMSQKLESLANGPVHESPSSSVATKLEPGSVPPSNSSGPSNTLASVSAPLEPASSLLAPRMTTLCPSGPAHSNVSTTSLPVVASAELPPRTVDNSQNNYPPASSAPAFEVSGADETSTEESLLPDTQSFIAQLTRRFQETETLLANLDSQGHSVRAPASMASLPEDLTIKFQLNHMAAQYPSDSASVQDENSRVLHARKSSVDVADACAGAWHDWSTVMQTAGHDGTQ